MHSRISVSWFAILCSLPLFCLFMSAWSLELFSSRDPPAGDLVIVLPVEDDSESQLKCVNEWYSLEDSHLLVHNDKCTRIYENAGPLILKHIVHNRFSFHFDDNFSFMASNCSAVIRTSNTTLTAELYTEQAPQLFLASTDRLVLNLTAPLFDEARRTRHSVTGSFTPMVEVTTSAINTDGAQKLNWELDAAAAVPLACCPVSQLAVVCVLTSDTATVRGRLTITIAHNHLPAISERMCVSLSIYTDTDLDSGAHTDSTSALDDLHKNQPTYEPTHSSQAGSVFPRSDEPPIAHLESLLPADWVLVHMTTLSNVPVHIMRTTPAEDTPWALLPAVVWLWPALAALVLFLTAYRVRRCQERKNTATHPASAAFSKAEESKMSFSLYDAQMSLEMVCLQQHATSPEPITNSPQSPACEPAMHYAKAQLQLLHPLEPQCPLEPPLPYPSASPVMAWQSPRSSCNRSLSTCYTAVDIHRGSADAQTPVAASSCEEAGIDPYLCFYIRASPSSALTPTDSTEACMSDHSCAVSSCDFEPTFRHTHLQSLKHQPTCHANLDCPADLRCHQELPLHSQSSRSAHTEAVEACTFSTACRSAPPRCFLSSQSPLERLPVLPEADECGCISSSHLQSCLGLTLVTTPLIVSAASVLTGCASVTLDASLPANDLYDHHSDCSSRYFPSECIQDTQCASWLHALDQAHSASVNVQNMAVDTSVKFLRIFEMSDPEKTKRLNILSPISTEKDELKLDSNNNSAHQPHVIHYHDFLDFSFMMPPIPDWACAKRAPHLMIVYPPSPYHVSDMVYDPFAPHKFAVAHDVGLRVHPHVPVYKFRYKAIHHRATLNTFDVCPLPPIPPYESTTPVAWAFAEDYRSIIHRDDLIPTPFSSKTDSLSNSESFSFERCSFSCKSHSSLREDLAQISGFVEPSAPVSISASGVRSFPAGLAKLMDSNVSAEAMFKRTTPFPPPPASMFPKGVRPSDHAKYAAWLGVTAYQLYECQPVRKPDQGPLHDISSQSPLPTLYERPFCED